MARAALKKPERQPKGPAPSPRAYDRAAAVVLVAYVLALLWTVLVWHHTPLYDVETDLVGDYIPAAQDLRAGVLKAERYEYKGFGYPLALAATSFLTHDDYFLAARLLNVAATAAGGTCAYLLARQFLGAAPGLLALLALLFNPVFLRAGIEAATDMPTFALSIASTAIVLTARRPPALLLAGFLAGFAVITRYNAAFLLPAALAVLLFRPGRRASLPAYALGAVLPIGAWMLVNQHISGSAWRNLNYMNLAYATYGEGVFWDRFWLRSGGQFHSLWDVVRFDPPRFLHKLAANAATHWWTDATKLMPPWIGALALPGMILSWRRRPGWPGMALHFLLCYLTLSTIFYSERFFLYLLPFYLSGAVALVLDLGWPWGLRSGRPHAGRGSLARSVRPALLGALIAGSAFRAVAEARSMLALEPYETREAAALLRSIGHSGEGVMARKPHVAYFAGMRYVPIPEANSFPDLIEAARAGHARYLFFSSMEAALRPQLMVLVDPGVSLPGLLQLAYRPNGMEHSFAVYQFTGERVDDATVMDSALVAIRRYARKRPGNGWALAYLAGHLLTRSAPREALAALDSAEHLSPRDVMVARMQTVAHAMLGEHDAAARACERAIRLGSDTEWEEAHLGEAQLHLGRYAEAREHLQRAVNKDPTRAEYAQNLAIALYHGGQVAEALRGFERLVGGDPSNSTARIYAARASLRLGRPERARELLQLPGVLTGPDSLPLRRLADSLGVGAR